MRTQVKKNRFTVLVDCVEATPSRVRKRLVLAAAKATMAELPMSVILRLLKHATRHTLTVSLVSLNEIHRLNQNYRGKNKPTDVLSFSQLEANHPMGQSHIGDVVISWQVAKEQAVRFFNTPEQELQRLTVHGILHLFGYDHEVSSAEEKRMFRLQEKILRTIPESPRSGRARRPSSPVKWSTKKSKSPRPRK